MGVPKWCGCCRRISRAAACLLRCAGTELDDWTIGWEIPDGQDESKSEDEGQEAAQAAGELEGEHHVWPGVVRDRGLQRARSGGERRSLSPAARGVSQPHPLP